jgi:hypothetical protein
VHPRAGAEPLRPSLFQLHGETEQQIFAGEIAVELHADRQTITVKTRRDADRGQASFVRRDRVASGVDQTAKAGVHARRAIARMVSARKRMAVSLSRIGNDNDSIAAAL